MRATSYPRLPRIREVRSTHAETLRNGERHDARIHLLGSHEHARHPALRGDRLAVYPRLAGRVRLDKSTRISRDRRHRILLLRPVGDALRYALIRFRFPHAQLVL